jgi:hypothetical protein
MFTASHHSSGGFMVLSIDSYSTLMNFKDIKAHAWSRLRDDQSRLFGIWKERFPRECAEWLSVAMTNLWDLVIGFETLCRES